LLSFLLAVTAVVAAVALGVAVRGYHAHNWNLNLQHRVKELQELQNQLHEPSIKRYETIKGLQKQLKVCRSVRVGFHASLKFSNFDAENRYYMKAPNPYNVTVKRRVKSTGIRGPVLTRAAGGQTSTRPPTNVRPEGPGRVVKWDNVTLNHGGGYNATSGVFTCPLSGVYHFDVHALGIWSLDAELILEKNEITLVALWKDGDYLDDGTLSHVMQLRMGDEVRVKSPYAQGPFIFYQDEAASRSISYFTGHLISADDCTA